MEGKRCVQIVVLGCQILPHSPDSDTPLRPLFVLWMEINSWNCFGSNQLLKSTDREPVMTACARRRYNISEQVQKQVDILGAISAARVYSGGRKSVRPSRVYSCPLLRSILSVNDESLTTGIRLYSPENKPASSVIRLMGQRNNIVLELRGFSHENKKRNWME